MQFASKTQNIARNAAKVGVRHFTKTTATEAKVAVIGAAGGIGQPLSLLMKASPHVDELALFDVVNTPGVAADISHRSFLLCGDSLVTFLRHDRRSETPNSSPHSASILTGGSTCFCD